MSRVRLQIAVVDDEAPIRKALQRLLRSAMMDVETYPSGSEFIEALSTHAPDCVVLDLHMPGVNGFDVLEHARMYAKSLPIVVITGHDTPEARNRCEACGVTHYLLKPIDESILLDAIVAETSQHR